jgi:hypothetical protein
MKYAQFIAGNADEMRQLLGLFPATFSKPDCDLSVTAFHSERS